MPQTKAKHLDRKPIPARGRLPYGYDIVGKEYIPHLPTIDKLEIAIEQIRDGKQPINSREMRNILFTHDVIAIR